MELPHEYTCKQWCSACTLFADEWAASVNRRLMLMRCGRISAFAWWDVHLRSTLTAELVDQLHWTCMWCRPSSIIVDIAVEFSTGVNDTFIDSIVPIIVHNLMEDNNGIELDGVTYPASIDVFFQGDVPYMNGSLISADNVTACVFIILSHL